MTKYILHGGFVRKDTESNKKFLEEFVKDVPENGNLLMVYFANEVEGEISEKFKSHIKIFKEKFPDKKLNINMATKENFLKEVEENNAILLNGGDTRKLITILQTYPELRSIFQNKTVAGSSAGAYALATLGAASREEVIREGLGFVPLRVICHYESLDLPTSKASIDALKNTRQDLELVILRDYEWKVFNY